MKITTPLFVTAFLGFCAHALTAIAQTNEQTPWNAAARFEGMGGLYLLPDEGELWIEIEKQDLNRRGSPAHLRAILVGPDREVLDEQWLPDDGLAKGAGLGPVQRLRLRTEVVRRGVYAVNITVTNDRYGEEVLWGFATNSPKYLVETSRGHKDEAHTEPLAVHNAEAPGDVCFLPSAGRFAIDVTGIAAGVDALPVYDPDGGEAGVLKVADGAASAEFEWAGPSTEPWRLHLPIFQGAVRIDGVTRWDTTDAFPDMSLWTPSRDAWFPLHQHRWLLTPYSRNVYSGDASEGEIAFNVHNNATMQQTITLTVESPEGGWPVELSANEVTLDAKSSRAITAHYRVPDDGDDWTCYVRATPEGAPEMSTYSALHIRRGNAPAEEPIAIPLVLKPYAHENTQFGYMPEYPLTNEVYFDAKNAPVVTDDRSWQVWRNDAWHTLDTAVNADGVAEPFELLNTKAAFDTENRAYCIGRQNGVAALLVAAEGAEVATAYPIPGAGSFDIEQFSGHNMPAGPPPFVRYTLTEKDPDLFWRRLNDLNLYVPRRADEGTLTVGEPILLSKKCIGYSGHSGKPSSIVSRDGKVHVVWAEATEPEEEAPGVPTFVATHDIATGETSAPVLVGYGPPANDVHNTPCITMDSKGYLHVLIGTHGRTFRYAKSLEPNTASGGFTESVDLGPGLRQTYIGLVCDRDDTLHAVFRLWRTDTEYFPSSHYACLTYMSKPADGDWSEPRPLIVSAFSEYSVFYHRLTIDREGSLFLSYDYWSTFWFYRNDHWGDRRALIMSPDQGQTWKLAAVTDLIP